MAKVNFHVYIVESPNAPDLYHKRFEGEALSQTLKLAGISSSHRLAVNWEAFQAAFYVGLKEYFEVNNLPPVIHISAHGDNNGIQLTDGKNVGWDDLKKLLVPVNKIMKGNLLLCLSTCKGFSGCRMSMKDEDFPFLAIIGSNDTPVWSETNIAYSTLYHLFARGVHITEAVRAMKVASGNNSFEIMYSKDARQEYLNVIIKSDAVHTMEQSIPGNQPTNLSKALI